MERRVALKTLGGIGLAASSAGWLTACGSSTNDAQIRLLNLLADAETLTLRVDGGDKASGVAFETVSPYAGSDGGTFTTDVISQPGNSTVNSASASIGVDNYYTVLVVGRESVVSVQIADDGEGEADDNKIKMRIMNYVPRGDTYDVYVTSSSASIDNANATFRSVGAGVGSFSSIDSGTWRIRVFAAGDKRELLFDCDGVRIDSKQVVSVVLYTTKSSRLVGAYLLHGKDSAGSSRVLPSTRARIRFANGTDVAGTQGQLRFRAGTASLSTLDANFSAYQAIGTGAQTLAAESGAGTIASLAGNLKPGYDYTATAFGSAGNYAIVLTADGSLPPRSGRAKLNVLNATTDGVQIDVSVDFSQDFPGIAAGAASGSVEYSAKTSIFSVRFYDATGGSQDFDGGSTFVDNGFVAGKTYALGVFGTPGARKVVLRDI